VGSENPYEEVVTASNLHICIRPSMSKFKLILAQYYRYMSFLNTPINLAIMTERSGFQLALRLSLLENATDTFIESFAA